MSRKRMGSEMELKTCLDKANRAIDLAVEELVRTRGGRVRDSGDDLEFLISLSRESRRLKTEIKKYLESSKSGACSFKETERSQRIGKIRSVDLVIACHGTSETREMFVVVDLKGEIFDKKEDKRFWRPSRVRFEAWCRLYYLPMKKEWFVHYVDIIIRHKSTAQRALFVIEHSRLSEEPSRAEERAPDALCLFFETPQGGTWG